MVCLSPDSTFDRVVSSELLGAFDLSGPCARTDDAYATNANDAASTTLVR
jgi:hypothetical protein